MKKDTFVNLDLLYEQMDRMLGDLNMKVCSAGNWLEGKEYSEEWIPEGVKRKIGYSKEANQRARDLLSEIQLIFSEFKKKGNRKPPKPSSERHRIEYLQIIKGGLYQPPEPIIVKDSDILSEAVRLSWTS